jgi:uncharacterized protein
VNAEILLAIPSGLLIGPIVGAVGGGGAILALPVLVFVLGEGVGPATTASLVVVAVASAFGGGALAREGRVDWNVAIAFFLPSAAGAVLGTELSEDVSARALIVGFIPVMLVAAAALVYRTEADPDIEHHPRTVRIARAAGAGLAVGLLTGFFGVGGGFLIVPALTLMLGFEMHRAVATSLVIIAVTGSVALATHLAAGAEPDWALTAALAGGTALGAVIGTRVGARLPGKSLARGLAGLIVVLAVFLLVDVLLLGGPPRA